MESMKNGAAEPVGHPLLLPPLGSFVLDVVPGS